MVLRSKVAVVVSEEPEWGQWWSVGGPARVCAGPTQKSAEQIFFLRGHTSQLVFLRVSQSDGPSFPCVEGRGAVAL